MKYCKFIRILLIFLFSLSYSVSFAQNYKKEIYEMMKETDKDKIDEAENFINQADRLFSEAKSDYTEESINNASKKITKASNIYEENYKVIYTLYRTNLNYLIGITDKEKNMKLNLLRSNAAEKFQNSVSFRKTASNLRHSKEKYKYLKNAHENEIACINFLVEAIAIHYGWISVEGENKKIVRYEESSFRVDEPGEKVYPKTKGSLKKIEGVIFKIQIAASKVTLPDWKLKRIYNGKNIVSVEKHGIWYKYLIGLYYNYKDAWLAKKSSGVKGVFAVAYLNGHRLPDITEVADPLDEYGNNLSNNNFINVSGKLKGDIEYRIQIGTSRRSVGQFQINKMNKTNLEVKTYKSGGYYKYTIGSFQREQDAVNYKNLNGLSNVIIVKYKNGVEIF